MNLNDTRKMNIEDIEKEILLQRKNLYEIRLKVKTGEEKNSTLIKSKKVEIARMYTVIKEKKGLENAKPKE